MWWRRDKKAKAAEAESSARGVPRFLDPEVLARIGSLELLARAVVEGFIAGLHRSPFTGFSTEFTEYRQYHPGDDLRYLDWRLLGRTDRFFIKKYRADTNAQVTLLVDTSGSMRYAGAEGGVTKLQYAQFLAAALAHLAARQQDAVGLTAFGREVHTHVPALNRTGHMRTIYGRLSTLEAGGETRLAEALHLTADRLTRRGVVVLISDFYESPERLAGAFQHLRFRGHDVIAFHVLDPREVEFDFEDSLLLLEDSETAEQLPVLPAVVAGGYRQRVNAHVEALRRTCSANHVDYELVTTDRPLDFALFSFLSRRAGR
ncbi:MAG: DUF58 domain-containing protein [Acidobacteria bacterium]|nr:DUF58 domain-containing protein [Acidobacteriota bacterium]